jgi:nitrate reductase delta subunit
MPDPRLRDLCGALSDLLLYPGEHPAASARRAAALAGRGPAADALARFARATAVQSLDALQELYTDTFDLRPTCAPYLGAQLLGDESPLRGPLLSKLAEVYAAEGWRPREELPDHVAEALGFLAAARPGPVADDLVRDGLLPALDRMIAALAQGPNPYRDVLVAARAALAGFVEATARAEAVS